MSNFTDNLPPPAELLGLEPEEIAIFVLDFLCREERQSSRTSSGSLHRSNFTNRENFAPYSTDSDQQKEISKVITEAWMWLEKEGMIAPQPHDTTGGWIFVTRKGYRLHDRADMEAYRKGHFLPKENLDEVLLRMVYPLFIRGDYDTAVFRAFKEVEVRVREKAGLPNSTIGVKLMREAFHPTSGPLTDSQATPGEKQATSELFAGSIGFFKNPGSHRYVEFKDPGEASEAILLANYLLRFL